MILNCYAVDQTEYRFPRHGIPRNCAMQHYLPRTKLTRHICARGIFPLNTVFETHLFIFVFNELENWSRASRYHRHYISSIPTIHGTIWDEKIPLNNDFYYHCVFAGCITIGVIPLRGLILIVMIIGVVKWIAYLQFLTPIKVS